MKRLAPHAVACLPRKIDTRSKGARGASRFTPAFRQEFERRFPEASVRPIAEAGHYVVEDAPEEVIEAIRGFLLEKAQPSSC